MVDPSEKLANDHAHDTQSCGFVNKMPQLVEHGLQSGAIGQLQSLANLLVKRFAQGSVCQVAIAPASAVLQSADEMEMAELNDPALGCAEPDNSGNLVGDRGPDASVNGGRDCCEGVRPALHVLSARQENRIQEKGSILMARLDCHQIQDPVFCAKAKVKAVQDQNHRSSRQAQNPRSRYELSQTSTETPTQSLTGKAVAWGESFQCASVEQHGLQSSTTPSPSLGAAPLLANTPRSLALTALTTSRTEVIDFGFATGRFRVARMHARELDIDYASKYPKIQVNFF